MGMKTDLVVGVIARGPLGVAGVPRSITAVVRLPPAACERGLWSLLALVSILGSGRTLPLSAGCKGILCTLQRDIFVDFCPQNKAKGKKPRFLRTVDGSS